MPNDKGAFHAKLQKIERSFARLNKNQQTGLFHIITQLSDGDLVSPPKTMHIVGPEPRKGRRPVQLDSSISIPDGTVYIPYGKHGQIGPPNRNKNTAQVECPKCGEQLLLSLAVMNG